MPGCAGSNHLPSCHSKGGALPQAARTAALTAASQNPLSDQLVKCPDSGDRSGPRPNSAANPRRYYWQFERGRLCCWFAGGEINWVRGSEELHPLTLSEEEPDAFDARELGPINRSAHLGERIRVGAAPGVRSALGSQAQDGDQQGPQGQSVLFRGLARHLPGHSVKSGLTLQVIALKLMKPL
jgi:hypothetical protein